MTFPPFESKATALTTTQPQSHTLSILPGTFAVCRSRTQPDLVDADFYAVTAEHGDWTVVCRESAAPPGASEVESGWIAIRVRGPFAFSEIGVLASIVGPLAEAGVSVYAVSTFATDYVLIKQDQRAAAVTPCALLDTLSMIRNNMLSAYHIDLGQRDVRIGMYEELDFDETGIPRYRYADGVHYNPTFVAHLGLYRYGLYLRTGEDVFADEAQLMADWLMNNGQLADGALVFHYNMAVPGLPLPWISALGQGRAISLLTRVGALREDIRYVRAAEQAMTPFSVDVNAGGVRAQFPDGGIAFEEYPRATPDIVLNGLITALFGLFDLSSTPIASDGGKAARLLFDSAVQSLAANLYHYDLGYWSAYDLRRRVASDEYHAYHVTLLWALYELTGVDVFCETARRWDGYRRGARLFVGRNLSRIKSRIHYRLAYR